MGAPSSSHNHQHHDDDTHGAKGEAAAEDFRKPPAKAKAALSSISTGAAVGPAPEEEEDSKIPAKVYADSTTSSTTTADDNMSLTSSMKVTSTRHQHQQPRQQQQRPRYVTFGTTTTVLHDTSLTPSERELCFHDPFELKKQTKSEIQLARKYYRRTGPHHRPNASTTTNKGFCYRGLEKRMQSTDVQKRKWYSFLQSFLALQLDLRKLEGDTTNLLAVFVSTHSKTDLASAYQMGRQDEAVAFRIYNTATTSIVDTNNSNGANTAAAEGRRLHLISNSNDNTISILKPSNSKTNLRNSTTTQPPSAPAPPPPKQQGCHLARKA